MHRLRSARFLACLVLAWFVAATGVAIASPMVQPRGLELVCVGGGGLKLLQPDGGEAAPMALDCPLCSVASAPPPQPSAILPLVRAHQVTAIAAGPALPAAPPATPPARGPPAPLLT